MHTWRFCLKHQQLGADKDVGESVKSRDARVVHAAVLKREHGAKITIAKQGGPDTAAMSLG